MHKQKKAAFPLLVQPVSVNTDTAEKRGLTMNLTEKVSYVKGLMEGMDLDQNAKENKLMALLLIFWTIWRARLQTWKMRTMK